MAVSNMESTANAATFGVNAARCIQLLPPEISLCLDSYKGDSGRICSYLDTLRGSTPRVTPLVDILDLARFLTAQPGK